ncbi:MAG: hypothetical protein AAFZ63_03865 [Bacteroidota bacterium]
MRTYKVFFLTLYFFIGILIPACDFSTEDDFDCNCSGSRFFNIMDLEIGAFSDFDNLTGISDGQQLRLNDFAGYYIDYVVDYHACAQPRQDWSLSLMTPAYACSCIAGYDGSKNEELVAFTVRTVNDFDADHPAGSSINDLFQYEGNFWDVEDIPLVDFLEEEQMDRMRFEDMRLRLLKAPEADSLVQVEVQMELSTGESFQVLSPAIVILP